MFKMGRGFYVLVSGLIFFLVGSVHTLRVYYGWGLNVGGWEVPIWVSWLGILLGYLMAFAALRIVR